MDVVGDTASILQLIETATTVGKLLYQYSKDVRNAPNSRKRLRDQIEFITTAALAAEEALKNKTTATTTTLQELSAFWLDPKCPAVKCRKTLEDLHVSLVQSGSTQMGIFQRLVWPISHEAKIKAAIKDLEFHIPYLHLTLTTFNTHASSRLECAVKKCDNGQEHIRNIVTKTMSEVGKVRITLENLHNSAELQEIYKWMDAIDCTVKHETTHSLRKDTTCEWLFQDERYLTWLSLKSGSLWIHGKPGAGKSVLVSATIEEILKTMSDKHALFKVYCDFRTERSTSASEVIRSLFAQALRQAKHDWRQEFRDLVNRKSNGSGAPVDLKILASLLIRALRLHERPIIVIDAVDECKDFAKLIRVLAELHDKASCRLFVTSRPLQQISTAFQDSLSIRLEDMAYAIRKDMKLHIETEVDLYPKLESFRDEIITSLLANADGMFRWVQCQLDRLSTCRARGDIRYVLDTLPMGLYGTYDRILYDVEKREFDGRRVRNALLWLVEGSIELDRLVELVMIDPDEDLSKCEGEFLRYEDLLEACGSLVRVENSQGSNYVTLSHFSVKEYFLSGHLRTTSLADYHILQVHVQLALKCIHYLLSSKYSNRSSTPQSSSPRRLKLAKGLFINHLGKVTPTELDDALVQSLLALRKQVKNDPAMYSCMYIWQLGCTRSSTAPDAGIHVLIQYGPSDPWLLMKYLEHNCEFSLTDVKDGDSPLTLTVAVGKYQRAVTLLDRGMDVNKRGLYHCLVVCPLVAAVMARREEFVSLFLSQGCIIPEDIIHTAVDISYGTGRSLIVTLLMEHGVGATTLRAGGNSPLHTLLSVPGPLHHRDVLNFVKTLVNAGCNPKAENDVGDTPLQLAIDAGLDYWGVVGYLLSKGAAFTDAHFHPDNLVHAASYPWYTLAAGVAHTTDTRRSTTLADVSRIRLLLQKRLKMPPSIVSRILDLARYWACTTIYDERPESWQMNRCTFLKPPPEHRKVHVQRVQFSAKRSTGRSSFVDPKVDIKVHPRIKLVDNLVSPSSIDFQGFPEDFTATKAWSRQDPAYRKILESLQPGDMIQIMPMFLKFLRIDVYYSVSFMDKSHD